MKKILFILILFFFPLIVFGMRVDSVFQKYEIKENGDVIVKKIVIADPDNGYFMNDAYLDRAFFFNDKAFDDDLFYAPTGIIPLRAGSTDKNLEKGYDLIDSFRDFYNFVEYGALPGDRGVYTVTDDGKNFEMRVFSPSGGKLRAYYFEYLVENAVRVHEDVAEVYIRLAEINFDYMVRKFEARVYTKSDIIGVFARGPIGGDYYKEGNVGVFIMNSVPSRSGITARVVISPDDVLASKNKTGIEDAYTKIQAVEESYVERRNQELATYKFIGNIINVILILIFGAGIYYFVKYKNERKEKDKVFPHKYLREFPSLDGPEVVGQIVPGQFTANYFSSSLMYLIERKIIEYSEITKKDIEFSLNAFLYDSVTDAEKKLIEMLFSKIGSNSKVSMKQVVDYSKRFPNRFMKEYNEWTSLAKKEAIKKQYLHINYIKPRPVDVLFGLNIFIMIFGAAFIGSVGGILAILNIFLLIIFYFEVNKHNKPTTDLGNEMSLKWVAVKKFIDDFGTFEVKELPHIELWGKYMVYAMAFGLATKLEKVMKVRIEQMPNNTGVRSDFNRFHTTMMVNHAISNSINSSISRAQSATRASSSGSGGGFSSGGGGGGFGGSGGGF